MAELMGSVEGRDAYEPAVEVILRAPGQRGILRKARSLRQGASVVLPLLGPAHSASIRVQQAKREREKRGSTINTLTMALKTRLQKMHVGFSKSAGADDRLVQRVGRMVETIRRIEEEFTAYRALLTETQERENAVAEATELNQTLSRELRQNLQRIDAASKSWASVRWTTDNAGATGRGPPGRIAYSPFTMYDPPFEVQDVVRLLEDTSKRAR